MSKKYLLLNLTGGLTQEVIREHIAVSDNIHWDTDLVVLVTDQVQEQDVVLFHPTQQATHKKVGAVAQHMGSI